MSKKIFSLVALFAAVVLLGGVRTAQAATAAELQAQINALLAQIGTLQGGSTMTSCYSFTRDLTIGSTGADVGALQAYLGTQGYFTVTPTSYFGPITASAVAKWQATAGITPAAGYFGAISRAKYNSMCSTSVPPTTGDDDDDNTGDDDDDFNAGNGDEASLKDYDAKDGDDTDLEEGDQDAQVMDVEFDVEDASVEIQRVEVTLDAASGNDEKKPWKVFEGATLWSDGKEIATADNLDDEDNWDEVSKTNGIYSFRFDGVDEVIDMGDTAKLTVSLDLQNNLDGVDDGEDWEIYVDDDTDGIRALDEAGIDQYIGDGDDKVSFSIEEAGNQNELKLSESDDNADAMTLQVDEDTRSDWESLGKMTLKADGDIQLNDFTFQTIINKDQAVDEVYNDVVNDLELVIDGETYNDFDVTNATTATATVAFDLDNEDVVINDGDEVEVEVLARFKAQTGTPGYDEGTTVTVDVPSATFDAVDAEGVDDGESLDTDQLDGSFEGEDMTLRTQGFSVGFVDSESRSPVESVESRMDGKIEFTVTAFGQNFFIPKSTARSATASSTIGAAFKIEKSDGTTYTSGTTTSALTAKSSVSGDTSSYFKVSDGQTRTFTLDVSLDNNGATSGYYGVQMVSLAFDTDTTSGGEQTVGSSELDEFDTDTVQVQNANVD